MSQPDQRLSNPSIKDLPRCLVANDSPMQLEILQMILKDQGYQVVKAENGSDALTQIKKSLLDPKQMFELVILDTNMPIMSGSEACTKIISLFDKQELIRIEHVACIGSLTSSRRGLQMKLFNPGFDVPLKQLLPVIVGCTSEILSVEMLDDCEK